MTMHVQRPFMLKTLHSWTKEVMLNHVEYFRNNGVNPDLCRYWVFRYKSGQDWAYLVTGIGCSWQDAREGHIRLAIKDGWVPEEVNLEYFK